MGIRFQCHQCQHSMHVKDFLAGKKSRCPTCQTRFRIPASGEARSLPVGSDESPDDAALSNEVEGVRGVVGSSPVQRSDVAVATMQKSPKGESVSAAESPSKLANAATAATGETFKWFVRPPSGGQYGPASMEVLTDWIQQKRVTADSLIWREGWTDWTPIAKTFPAFFAEPTPPPPPPSLPPVSTALPPVAPTTEPVAATTPPMVPIAAVSASVTPLQESTFSAQQKAMLRLKKKKKKQLQIVAILSLLAIVLIVALVIVLIWNPAVPTNVKPPA